MNHNVFFEESHFNYNYSVNASWVNAPTEFPLHWHTFGEIVLALKDNVHAQVQGKDYILRKNDVLFIWPGELHATLHAEQQAQLIVQYFGNLLNTFPEMTLMQNQILSIHHISAQAKDSPASEISRHMADIRDTFHTDKRLNDMRMQLSLYHLLLILYDYATNTSQTDAADGQQLRLHTIQAITKACCYITENCEKDLSLNEVAAHVGISKFHFSRCFKEYTQTSFSDYLATQRIQKAILLFENPEISIAEAAFQSGFGSIASFNRSFKKYKNCTPSDYRNLMRLP